MAAPLRIFAIILMLGTMGWFVNAFLANHASAEAALGRNLPYPFALIAFTVLPIGFSIWKTGQGERVGFWAYLLFCIAMLAIDFRGYVAAIEGGRMGEVIFRLGILIMPLLVAHFALPVRRAN